MSLAKDLLKIASKRKQDVNEIVQSSFFQAGQRTISRTPRRTGRAAANWLSAIGDYDGSTTEDTDPSKSGALLLRKSNELELGEEFYFTNSLPYIERLEYEGWSAQAPSGMLRVSLAEFPRIVENEIKKRRK